MDIKSAATELGISTRHVRRLIETGQIPAQRIRVQKTIEVEVWDIDDSMVKAAKRAFDGLCKHENYAQWVYDTAKRLGLTLQDLAKRTKLPIGTLVELGTTRGYLSASDQEIEDRIGKVLMRADIEKRCTDAGK